MAFEKLFEPIQIRNLTLKNRIVMSAMGTHESAESEEGRMVTDKLIAFHVARVKGGCGLNIVECTSIDQASAPHVFLSIGDDKYIPGFKKLNEEIHAAGGKSALQLWQGGLAVASDPNAQILLPSDMPLSPEYTCPGISEDRIQSIIQAFGEATRRAIEAGFDTVQFHCAHNYLPHSFLSGGINKRTDEWGGSFENRKKFPLACIRSIRENMPEDMPLLMRIDCHDDMLPGGLTVEEVIEFCKDAKEAGVDLLDISRGNILTAATVYEVAPVDIPNGFNVEDAARIRQETGMLTMPCGRINHPELAQQILAEDKADLVVMARAQLADANFCHKVKAGQLTSIKYCIGCNQGCYDYFANALYDPSIKHITCMRNPALLEETMSLEKTKNPKKVLIAGGGIAGIEAADALNQCGYIPVIYEKGKQLGGQFMIAGVAPRKADFTYAGKMAIQNIIDQKTAIHLGQAVDKNIIENEKPDAVIIAIGSSPIQPGIPGIDQDFVVSAHDILHGKQVDVKNAVVIGGGLVGIETAEYLVNKGVKVTVVEMKDEVLTDLGQLRQIGTKFALAKEPITILTKATCQAIEENQVVIEREGNKERIDADLVVIAVGSKPNNSDDLIEQCKQLNIPYFVVGDAFKAPALALNAIHDAYHAVLKINQL